MNAINAILGRIVDASRAPFSGLPEWIGIAVVTFVVTLIAMPIIKWTLSPALSDRMKRRLQAAILELRLFNDSLRATFRALFEMLFWTGGYLFAWLVPILILAVPMLPLFSHLHAHWGFRGLEVDKPVTLTVKLDTDDLSKPNATLTADGDGIEIETPALWIPARKELLWRIRPTAEGEQSVTVRYNGEGGVKELAVKELAVIPDGPARRSPVRAGSFVGQLLYPSESSLVGTIHEISVPYPETPTFLLLPLWVWLLLVFSIPFALILKKPFKVEF